MGGDPRVLHHPRSLFPFLDRFKTARPPHRFENPTMAAATRTEKDPLGPKEVPVDALYGVQTLRARENFPISGLAPLWPFVMAQTWIKKAAALTHKETGRLDAKLADAIVQAAGGGRPGQPRDEFVGD